jgi:predicted trehalose synthase
MLQPVSLDSRFKNPRFHQTLLRNLASYMGKQRWFTSKGKDITNCTVTNCHRVTEDSVLLVVSVNFGDDSTEMYQMPLAQLVNVHDQKRYMKENGNMILLRIPGGPFIVDAVPLPAFRKAIYAMIRDGAETRDGLNCEAGKLLRSAPENAESIVPSIDTSNTAIIYGDRYFFKLFRKLDPGLNPDLELVRYLSDKTPFTHCPPYGGSIGVGKMTDDNYLNLGMLSGKVENQGDAWEYFQALTASYFSGGGEVEEETLNRVRLLGQRTAEMHLALSGESATVDTYQGKISVMAEGSGYYGSGADAGAMMVPEAMTADYRKEITAAAIKLLNRQVRELGAKIASLPAALQPLAQKVLDLEDSLTSRLQRLSDAEMDVSLIRIHADYHLGQVLVTPDDFCIIDFEGEPLLSIPERRRKRPALKDVAGMVRSFHYAANGQLLLNEAIYADQDPTVLEQRANHWYKTVSAAYLAAYYDACGNAPFLPASEADRQLLLDLFILEKAVYEVAYELNSRPAWLGIPLMGVVDVMGE